MVIKIIKMEREIKFRAWNGEKIVFRGLHDRNWYTENIGGKLVDIAHPNDKREMSIMQFTGLKDKNGVDIYEGDIVRILYTDWPSKHESDHRTLQQYLNDISYIAKVVFERNSWRVSIYSEKYQEWYFGDITPGQHGFIEIIGNIHENPELLDPR